MCWPTRATGSIAGPGVAWSACGPALDTTPVSDCCPDRNAAVTEHSADRLSATPTGRRSTCEQE